jgi:AbiJ N-terminal domain 4
MLWNELQKHYLAQLHPAFVQRLSEYRETWERIWLEYLQEDIDALPGTSYWQEFRTAIKRKFTTCQWYELYDFLELMVDVFPAEPNTLRTASTGFLEGCNSALERGGSAYRFVDRQIARIVSPSDIAAVEEAISPHSLISKHLERALELLTDRTRPDMRNSIKESISAVEAWARHVTGSQSATLGEALNEIKRKQGVHPALIEGFRRIYGYTSDQGGIRHALSEGSEVRFAEAKLMLVMCSAFVNYATELMSIQPTSQP